MYIAQYNACWDLLSFTALNGSMSKRCLLSDCLSRKWVEGCKKRDMFSRGAGLFSRISGGLLGFERKSLALFFASQSINSIIRDPPLLQVCLSGKTWSLQTQQSVTAWSCQSPPAAMWIALELVRPGHGWRAEVTYHIFGRRRGLRKNTQSGEWDYSHSPWRTSPQSSMGATPLKTLPLIWKDCFLSLVNSNRQSLPQTMTQRT